MKQLPSLSSLPERFPVARKYLVGVSGGRDSVAMLDALVELGYRKLVVCHLNHRARGRASGADARFVTTLGKRRGLTVESRAENVPRLARAARQSLETAARLARHRFFFEAAARHRCRRIFLAHHADDQVESVLMHMFRGAGLGGLAGMRETTVMQPPPGSAARAPLNIIRPMLNVWRAEIDTYIEARGLSWRDDSSNASAEHLRNRVRSSLLPELCGVFRRDVAPLVHRLAEIAREDDDCLTLLADQALRGMQAADQSLPTDRLRSQHPALQRRVLRRWLESLELAGVGFSEIESVRALLISTHSSKVNLPDGRHARRRAGRIFIE